MTPAGATRRKHGLAVALVFLLIPGAFGYYFYVYNVGTVSFKVTDDAIRDFRSLNITFSEVAVHSDSTLTTSAWSTIQLTTTTIDLTKLEHNASQELGLSTVPAGRYTQVRILVLAAEGVLTTGEHLPVTVPGGELRTQTPFKLEPGGQVSILVRLMVVATGGASRYVLQPALGSIDGA